MPRACVCIPAYNAAEYIGDTLDSVLGQTMSDFEVVVVDNCSTDATRDIVERVRDPRVRLFVNDANVGVIPNWNRAVAATSSEIVKLVCADDLVYPTCLERQVGQLESSRSAVLAVAWFDHVTAAGRVVRRGNGLHLEAGAHGRDEVVRHCIAKGQTLLGPACAITFKRDAFDAAGGFHEDAYPISDFDAWCRILRHGECVVDPVSLSAFRLHGASVSTVEGLGMGRKVRELLHALDVELSGRPSLAGRMGRVRSRIGDSLYLAHMRRSARV